MNKPREGEAIAGQSEPIKDRRISLIDRLWRLRVSVPPPRRQWRSFALQIYDKLFEDEVFGRAAQLAYYWLFSLFPLLILMTSLLALSPLADNLGHWIEPLNRVLPPEAFVLVKNTFSEITERRRGGLLSFSILVVIWSSSSGMGAVITSLNKAFDAPDTRPWWKERLLAILLTVGLSIFIIAALLLIFFGDHISSRLAATFGYGQTFIKVWNTAQWVLVITFVLIGIELIYYFAPNTTHRWEFFTPGTLFALFFWLLISFGFRFYVTNFTNYSAIYGALGGVMVLMAWLYLTGVGILVGGVINSVIRRK